MPQIQFLGWEDPLEDGMATHSSILAWRILMDRGAWGGPSPWSCIVSDTTEELHLVVAWFLAYLAFNIY